MSQRYIDKHSGVHIMYMVINLESERRRQRRRRREFSAVFDLYGSQDLRVAGQMSEFDAVGDILLYMSQMNLIAGA